MVNILFDYLRQKVSALGFVAQAYSLAEIVTRDSGGNNVSYPAVYDNGELKQVSFDTVPSLVFFMLDGDVKRKTEPGEVSSEDDQVTETIPAKAYFFHSGKEITDCASFSQNAAYSIAKFITSDNSQLEDGLNLQSAIITCTSFSFKKESVWNELHSGIAFMLSDRIQLCSISFEIEISGVESCFVSDPCATSELIWEITRPSNQVYSFVKNGNGTNTITVDELIGKTLLLLFTDGLNRNFNPIITPKDATFTSSTGTIVFESDIAADSIITGLYK